MKLFEDLPKKTQDRINRRVDRLLKQGPEDQWNGTRRWRRKIWEARRRMLDWAYSQGLQVDGNKIHTGKSGVLD